MMARKTKCPLPKNFIQMKRILPASVFVYSWCKAAYILFFPMCCNNFKHLPATEQAPKRLLKQKHRSPHWSIHQQLLKINTNWPTSTTCCSEFNLHLVISIAVHTISCTLVLRKYMCKFLSFIFTTLHECWIRYWIRTWFGKAHFGFSQEIENHAFPSSWKARLL